MSEDHEMSDEKRDAGGDEPAADVVSVPGFRQDLATLMKVKLNTFVLVTAVFGYVLGSMGGEMQWWTLLHTIIGVAAAAFGSAAFNQLMEVDLDARMKRTADRPLPSRRMDPLVAFGVGWVLSAVGIIHLAVKVGNLPAYLTAATIAIYVFIYTPLKRFSSLNTFVGAIPGAVPPMIGWVAAGGGMGYEAWFLFSLLFFWQLPHFIAINWLCREEYEAAGYVMWSNGDVSGRKSGWLSAFYALCLAAVSVVPGLIGSANVVWTIAGPLLGLLMMALAIRFAGNGERASARKLFLFTLLYLPLALLLLVLTWK